MFLRLALSNCCSLLLMQDNLGSAFAGDPTHGTAHSTADIGNHHALPQLQLFDHQALMAERAIPPAISPRVNGAKCRDSFHPNCMNSLHKS